MSCDPKMAAAKGAIDLLQSMGAQVDVIGIGTGSTVARFIEAGEKFFRSRTLVASSIASTLMLAKRGLLVVDPISVSAIDVYVDGADEVDPEGRLIKGRGGALLGEKMLAFRSKVNIIIVDNSKLVDRLGTRKPLPIEVIPSSLPTVLDAIERIGFKAKPRESGGKDGPVISDWGGLIVDVVTGPMSDPERIDLNLKTIPGIVETGLFIGLTDYVVVGGNDCTWKVMRFTRTRGLHLF